MVLFLFKKRRKMIKKITLEEVPRSVCIYMVHSKTVLEFDNQFCVHLDKARLMELKWQCERALQCMVAEKGEEIADLKTA
jgi:hypothetical protein